MKSLLTSLLVAAVLILQSSTVPSSPTPSTTAAANVQVVEVTAKKYEFNPSPIRVKQGTKVQLRITATDHAHGFRIRAFPEGGEAGGHAGLVFSSANDCYKIEKGQTATIEFVAQTPGTYPFKCCVHCGWHHRSMTGELIVEP
ncbi:MAG TPA: cupredoxin domain-containing protein [Terriglobales bacterium]